MKEEEKKIDCYEDLGLGRLEDEGER